MFVFYLIGWLVGFMVFNATFNNVSAISWWSVLLVEETGKPLTCCNSLFTTIWYWN